MSHAVLIADIHEPADFATDANKRAFTNGWYWLYAFATAPLPKIFLSRLREEIFVGACSD
jgi:hypothetical protein